MTDPPGTSAPVRLSREDTATVLDALDVASEYLRDRARDPACYECAHAEGWLCGEHAADLARAREFDALARTLDPA